VSGLDSSQALAKLVSQGSSVILVDPIADINALLARYRTGVVKVLIAGGVIIALLLAVICGWRLALQIMLLPVIACVMSLAVTGYINSSYTIVNLLAMLLIIGVSLDYAIFRVFTAPVDQPATSLAITLSALTSILAFGMLAFSQTPLISDFGQTIAFGLIFTYSLSWVRFEWKT
jgi:predicted exporter